MPVQIRYLEFIPHEQGVILKDPLGIVEPMLVSPETAILIFAIATSEDYEQVKKQFQEQTGLLIKDEDIDNLIKQLDELYLLYNDRFLNRLEEIEKELREKPYKSLDVVSEEEYLELQSRVAVGVDGGSQFENNKTVGLLVPHIDYRIAFDTYVKAYSSISASSRDIIFILGVPHSMSRQPISILDKPYHVYSSVVHQNEDVIAFIREKITEFDPTSDILAFRNEHSIEFPVVFLSLFRKKPFTIVPIIVSESDRESLQRFADAIMDSIRGMEDRALFISSVDFSHVGRKFGDAEPFDTTEVDRTYLDYLLNLQNNEAYEYLEEIQNYTRIDGQFTNYLFIELMKRLSGGGVLEEYEKYEEKETDSVVTYAMARFDAGK